MHEKLATIRVLWRQPDTMSLWGIPYKMRRDVGQQPYDLWKANRAWLEGHGPKVSLDDWIYLGAPGWWGHLSEAEQFAIRTWLESYKDLIPGGPCEWSEVHFESARS